MFNKMELYVVKDVISGLFQPPIAMINADTAKRWFIMWLRGQKNFAPTDFELYYIAVFDTSTAEIGLDTGMSFIMRGELYE